MRHEAPRRRPLVVVIDDDPTMVEILERVLDTEGYQVEGCSEWEWAVRRVDREQPDVVVLDLLFSGQERGWELLHALKTNQRTQAIPVVLCSSSIDSLSRNEAAIQASDTRVVKKPFDLYDLTTTLRSVTRQPADRR